MELRWLMLYMCLMLICTKEKCYATLETPQGRQRRTAYDSEVYDGDDGVENNGDEDEIESLVVILTECDYNTAEAYCRGIGGELAEIDSVSTYIDCIKQTIDFRPKRKYWVSKDGVCRGPSPRRKEYCVAELNREPNFEYEGNDGSYFSLCEIDLLTYPPNPNITTSLCSPTTTTRRTTSELTSQTILTTLKSNQQSTKESDTTIGSLMTTTPMSDFVTPVTEGSNNYSSTSILTENDKTSEKLPDDSKGGIVVAVIGVICFLLFAIGTTLFIAAVRRVNQKRKSDKKMAFRSLNNMRPDQSVPSSATDSNKYFILEESAYSEVKENETDNLTNNNNQSTNETNSKANSKEGMYDHLQRNESETRNDVKGGMYSHIHNKASDETLNNAKEDFAQGNNMYDHLEGKTGSENNKKGTSIRKSVDLNPEYDHTAFFKDSSESQYDHTDLEANKKTSSTENEDYDHVTLIK